MSHPASHIPVVSFSGIDGAGKSTQIAALESHLRALGLRPAVYTFWDNVVALPRMRERLSHKAFAGDQGVGSPEHPIDRRDKNVTSWYLTLTRMFLYFLDALSLRLVLSRIRSRASAGDFIIFDRYIYDELANLPLHRTLVRFYVRLLVAFSPLPAISFLIDADPQAARMRKPEYPLEFLRSNRQTYLALTRSIPTMTILRPGSAEEITRQMLASISTLAPAPSSHHLQRIDAVVNSGTVSESTVNSPRPALQ